MFPIRAALPAWRWLPPSVVQQEARGPAAAAQVWTSSPHRLCGDRPQRAALGEDTGPRQSGGGGGGEKEGRREGGEQDGGVGRGGGREGEGSGEGVNREGENREGEVVRGRG